MNNESTFIWNAKTPGIKFKFHSFVKTPPSMQGTNVLIGTIDTRVRNEILLAQTNCVYWRFLNFETDD